MPEPTLELPKRTLDLLILRTLILRPPHGSAIAERFLPATQGTVQVNAGFLFPALHRLVQEGRIAGQRQTSTERRRVPSHTLTREGGRQMTVEKTWTRTVQAMNALPESA